MKMYVFFIYDNVYMLCSIYDQNSTALNLIMKNMNLHMFRNRNTYFTYLCTFFLFIAIWGRGIILGCFSFFSFAQFYNRRNLIFVAKFR